MLVGLVVVVMVVMGMVFGAAGVLLGVVVAGGAAVWLNHRGVEVGEGDVEVEGKGATGVGATGGAGGGAVPRILYPDQVFNVPGNTYTYKDAQALCKAFDAQLATAEQVEQAYQKGADWCAYGWSDGQMALFPTQPETWQRLQKMPGHERDCGRPGVNGGFFPDAGTRLGVNCFGKKPRITPDEAAAMQNAPLVPPTRLDLIFAEHVAYWKQRLAEIGVNPFSHVSWSQ